MKKVAVCFLSVIFGILWGGMALAQHGHGHGHDSSAGDSMSQMGHSMDHSMATMNRPVQSITVEGMKISLDIMDMSMHTSMQKMKGNPAPGDSDVSKSHAIMVVIQDTASKEIITDAKVNYTLISPSGAKETGKLDWSGDHYGQSFNPKEKGAYQVQLNIENGGMEREAIFTNNL